MKEKKNKFHWKKIKGSGVRDSGESRRDCDGFRKSRKESNVMCTNLLIMPQATLSHFQKSQSTEGKEKSL